MKFESLETRSLLAASPLDLLGAPTHTAVESGAWEDRATWGGIVPSAGDHVVIPAGLDVVIGQQAVAEEIRVDGSLELTDRSALSVETLVVAPSGELAAGEPGAPISTRVDFVGEVSFEQSLGLISMGHLSIHGEAKTGRAALTQPANRGDRILYVDVPADWKTGDEIVIPNSNPAYNINRNLDDQRVSILAIGQDRLLISESVRQSTDADFILNMTRSIEFTSPGPERGHFMVMNDDAQVEGTAFIGLGRTDALRRMGTDSNPRGLYPLHLHELGTENPVVVRDVVIDGSPGWGAVCHSANCDFEDVVVVDSTGAGVVTEVGDEVFRFDEISVVNLEGRRKGSWVGWQPAAEGTGVWLQDFNGQLSDVQVVNATSSGVAVYQPTQEVDMSDVHTHNTYIGIEVWDGAPSVSIADVSITGLRKAEGIALYDGVDNVVVNNAIIEGPEDRWFGGIRSYGFGIHPYGTDSITVADSTITGFHTGILMPIAGSSVISNTTLQNIRDIAILPEGVDKERGVKLQDVVIQIDPSTEFLPLDQQKTDIYFVSPLERIQRRYEDGEKIRSGRNTANTQTLAAFVSQISVFEPFAPTVLIGDQQLYFAEQAAEYVPFPADTVPRHLLDEVFGEDDPASFIADDLIGLTNQELFDEYGLAVAGSLAPADAVAAPNVKGLLGPVAARSDAWVEVVGDNFVPEVIGPSDLSDGTYSLMYDVHRTGTPAERRAVDVSVVPGWNIVSVDVDGERKSLQVYLDVWAPVVPDWEVAKAEGLPHLEQSIREWRINGTTPLRLFGGNRQIIDDIDDSSFGYAVRPQHVFLSADDIEEDERGRFVLFVDEYVDIAGNITPVPWRLNVV